MLLGVTLGIILLLYATQSPIELTNTLDTKDSPQSPPCFANLSPEARVFAEELKKRVKKDLEGRIPDGYIDDVFCRETLRFNPDVMLRSLTWKEAKLPYHQFLEPNRIQRARAFLEEHFGLLSAIEEKFRVDKEVIVAILLVETDLGTKTGNHQVLNTFFSLALAGNEALFKRFVENHPEIDFNNETVRRRWERRSNWAYRELLHFIEISYKNQWDPYEIRGSIFGAFGFPQFVPRSYAIYGFDWDGDGRVDLFSIPDALASIANYLRREGYRMDADRDYKKRIIMKYNISEPYAETVLAIAEILKLKKNLLTLPNGQSGN